MTADTILRVGEDSKGVNKIFEMNEGKLLSDKQIVKEAKDNNIKAKCGNYVHDLNDQYIRSNPNKTAKDNLDNL
jgi:hypothetical protein